MPHNTGAGLPAIDRINLEAFLDHPYSHQTEHPIVRALRASGALTLSLVADLDHQTVGHIAFSPASPADPARRQYARFGFEPCPSFDGYREDPNSVFMPLRL